MQGEDLETPIRVPKPAGGFEITGCVIRGVTYEVENTGSGAIAPGDIVCLRVTGTTLQRTSLGRWNTLETENLAINALRCVQSSAASNKPIGVALETIVAGGKGEVAGVGSIVMANYDNGQPAAVVGDEIVVSLISGTCMTGGNTPGINVPGTILGTCYIANGTAAGESGSATQVGVLVNPR